MPDDHDDELHRLIDGDPTLGLIAQAPRQHRKRFATALQVEDEAARDAGMLGYQARILVQCSLPYRRQLVNEWTRRNGAMTLTLLTRKDIGLPYGAIPRLLLTWVTTQAVRTQTRRIELGSSLTRFMADLGIARHANGREIRRFKDQTQRLFSTTISSTLIERDAQAGRIIHDTGFRLSSEMHLWWDAWGSAFDASHIILSEDFYRTITGYPVPVDLRDLQALKGSALALDIYSWLVYRLSYLKKPTTIPWELLQRQFGSEYANTRSGRYAFKKDFQEQLQAALQVYSAAKVSADTQGLALRPSPLHISRS